MVEKLKAVERRRPGTAAELQAVQEGIRVLETLVGMGEEQNRKYASAKRTALVQSMFFLFIIYHVFPRCAAAGPSCSDPHLLPFG